MAGKHPLFKHERARARVDSMSRLAVCISLHFYNGQRSADFQFRTIWRRRPFKKVHGRTVGLQNDRRCSARLNNSKYGLRAPLCDGGGLRGPYPRHTVPWLSAHSSPFHSTLFVVMCGFVASILSSNPVNSGGTRLQKTEFFISTLNYYSIVQCLYSLYRRPSRRSVLIFHPYGSIIIIILLIIIHKLPILL